MTKHTVSAAATGLPEFTRRAALLGAIASTIAGTVAVAATAALVPTKSPFMHAADAYTKLYWFGPFGEDEEGDLLCKQRMDDLHDRLLATPLADSRDAARLLQFIQAEELSDAGDRIAITKLIQFLSA
jgi:hypothetical protein